jgi:hypothetical protein
MAARDYGGVSSSSVSSPSTTFTVALRRSSHRSRSNRVQIDGIAGPAPERPGLRLPVLPLEVYERHGGHTLRHHVGTTPADDVRRIESGNATGAGSFLDRDTAQHCVEMAIGHHAGEVRAWLQRRARFMPHTISDDMHQVIGHSLTWADLQRGERTPQPVTGVFLVLRRCPELPGGYTVRTAYPTRARKPSR